MRKLVTVQKIEEIKPIEGADKIEAARVKGWWVVVQKDQFKVGEDVFYYEIDSFLPVKPEYEFLLKGSNPKKMICEGNEIQGIRLKTIKLRGQISQGLIMPIPPDFITPDDGDVSELLGVVKYEIPIPPCLVGKIKGNFPGFIPKTDEERIQNMADVLQINSFYVTEKIDGTSTTFYKKDGVFGVCSRNVELANEEEVNTKEGLDERVKTRMTSQWRIAKELDLANIMPDNFVLQGELVGEGIQGNPLKINGQRVYFFNAYNIKTGVYLNYADFVRILNHLSLLMVPLIDDDFRLPKTVDELLKYAEGKSIINSNVEREGVVVRPKVEAQYKGQRLSFKVINNVYLLNEK
jgi:RNA ligase (TIGR02306 family)